jgi:hypothetical protein
MSRDFSPLIFFSSGCPPGPLGLSNMTLNSPSYSKTKLIPRTAPRPGVSEFYGRALPSQSDFT